MRVLFFNYEYPPLGGGAANATEYILREFSKISDLEVDLITSSVDKNYHLEQVGGHLKIHRLPIGKNEKNLHFQSQKDLLVYSWKAFWFGRKLIRQNKYDLSHSFFTVPCGFLSLVYYKLYNIPYVVSLRGSDVPGYSDRFGFIYIFLTPIIKFIWKHASAVVSNSDGLKELALQTGAHKEIDMIPNGIDTEQFYPDANRREADRFVITPGASRVTHRKGLNYLLDAVAKLTSKYPNIYVEVVGDGNARGELEKQAKKIGIEKNISFLGRVPHEKVGHYYQRASLFVLPSLNEGMSNAMLEALAFGLPIISTPTGGADELVKDGVNGYIINFKNAGDIVEKVEKIINNKDLQITMGNESRKLAETMSWKNVAQQYVDLYKKVKNYEKVF